ATRSCTASGRVSSRSSHKHLVLPAPRCSPHSPQQTRLPSARPTPARSLSGLALGSEVSRLLRQLAHARAPARAVRNHRAHLFELPEAEQAILGLKHNVLSRVRNDLHPTVQGEHGNVAIPQTKITELLADVLGPRVHH